MRSLRLITENIGQLSLTKRTTNSSVGFFTLLSTQEERFHMRVVTRVSAVPINIMESWLEVLIRKTYSRKTIQPNKCYAVKISLLSRTTKQCHGEYPGMTQTLPRNGLIDRSWCMHWRANSQPYKVRIGKNYLRCSWDRGGRLEVTSRLSEQNGCGMRSQSSLIRLMLSLDLVVQHKQPKNRFSSDHFSQLTMGWNALTLTATSQYQLLKTKREWEIVKDQFKKTELDNYQEKISNARVSLATTCAVSNRRLREIALTRSLVVYLHLHGPVRWLRFSYRFSVTNFFHFFLLPY